MQKNLWSTAVAPEVLHPRLTRRDAATLLGCCCPRVSPHRATWIPCVFSQLAPMRLRLGPIRTESGQLEPYWPKSVVSAEMDNSGRNSKKKKKVQNAPFDLYLNPTLAHFTQTPKHKLSTSSHISSLTRLCALCLSASVSSPLWLWDTQPLGTHSIYYFNSFFLHLSLTHS